MAPFDNFDINRGALPHRPNRLIRATHCNPSGQTHQHLHHPFITGGRVQYIDVFFQPRFVFRQFFQNIKGQAPGPGGQLENIDISCQESFQNTVCGQTGRISGCDMQQHSQRFSKKAFSLLRAVRYFRKLQPSFLPQRICREIPGKRSRRIIPAYRRPFPIRHV